MHECTACCVYRHITARPFKTLFSSSFILNNVDRSKSSSSSRWVIQCIFGCCFCLVFNFVSAHIFPSGDFWILVFLFIDVISITVQPYNSYLRLAFYITLQAVCLLVYRVLVPSWLLVFSFFPIDGYWLPSSRINYIPSLPTWILQGFVIYLPTLAFEHKSTGVCLLVARDSFQFCLSLKKQVTK